MTWADNVIIAIVVICALYSNETIQHLMSLLLADTRVEEVPILLANNEMAIGSHEVSIWVPSTVDVSIQLDEGTHQ